VVEIILKSSPDGNPLTDCVLLEQHRPKRMGEKKPGYLAGFFYASPDLLQFHFFVIDVLASFWIKFLDQHLLGHELFVFAGGVEVTGSSSRFKLDFFACAFGCHDVFLFNQLRTELKVCPARSQA
jgi:hypothetical protein